jgi:phage-related protein
MQAVYYQAADGTEPVREFIDALAPARQVVLGNQISLLNMLGPNDPPLAFPHSSQVAGELRELRCHYGRELYRILYQRSHNLFVLLHILEKRSGALPRADIDLARMRMADFTQRMNASPRRPPRAAGHDAP